MNFDFLNKIGKTLNTLWGNASGLVKGTMQPLKVAKGSSPVPEEEPAQAMPQPTAAPTAVPTPTAYPEISGQDVMRGFERYGQGTAPPAASASEYIAELGNRLRQIEAQARIDPYFAAALALKESSGGKNIQEGSNNPYGLMSFDQEGNRSLATYPDFQTATMGGGPNDQMGLQGTIFDSGNYNDFLKSGNTGDFLDTYSPAGENDSIEGQVETFRKLLEYFRPENAKSPGKKTKKESQK